MLPQPFYPLHLPPSHCRGSALEFRAGQLVPGAANHDDPLGTVYRGFHPDDIAGIQEVEIAACPVISHHNCFSVAGEVAALAFLLFDPQTTVFFIYRHDGEATLLEPVR